GLTGLVFMAIPSLGGHHGTHGAGHAALPHAAHAHTAAHAHPPAGTPATQLAARPEPGILAAHRDAEAGRGPRLGWQRWVPSPRGISSALALYGAFGNALRHAGRLTPFAAGLLAVVPAALVEWFAVRPIWRAVLRSQGTPATPLETLILTEAQAVTPFRNGRGLVSTTRDGRHVQLSARLTPDQEHRSVTVGQRLRIEDVDARNERLTVSIMGPGAEPASKGKES
ncbi:MAG TPA: hypothetical protein VLT58_15955, partial [Polyangia bacterium]|nr:hypothetical protein [Polyangia bacterium]